VSTSSTNPPSRVVAARSELEQCLDHLNAIRKTLTGILERPDPRTVETDEKGWPILGWEAHDDPKAGR
jgi:hypothetical protein